MKTLKFVSEIYWPLKNGKNEMSQGALQKGTNHSMLKFSFSEEATKIWCNCPQGFDTKQCQNLKEDGTKFCGLLIKAEL